jgi:hypothetical protein
MLALTIAGSARAADPAHQLLGTWMVKNETVDSTYSGSKATGQVTFFADHLTVDAGALAAAGIVSASESSFCSAASDPISFKLVGSGTQRVLYLTWLGKNRNTGQLGSPVDSAMTILKLSKKSAVLMGTGGCGALGTPHFSYLTRP